jgi:hypothetical protein
LIWQASPVSFYPVATIVHPNRHTSANMSYPTTSLHSFTDVLQKRLTSPFSICLGIGLGAAGYHAAANVSSYFFGPVPAINEEKLELKKDVGQAVQVWEWFYENATVSLKEKCLPRLLAIATSQTSTNR